MLTAMNAAVRVRPIRKSSMRFDLRDFPLRAHKQPGGTKRNEHKGKTLAERTCRYMGETELNWIFFRNQLVVGTFAGKKNCTALGLKTSASHGVSCSILPIIERQETTQDVQGNKRSKRGNQYDGNRLLHGQDGIKLASAEESTLGQTRENRRRRNQVPVLVGHPLASFHGVLGIARRGLQHIDSGKNTQFSSDPPM